MSREVHVRFWEGLGLKCPGLLTISWNRTMAGGAGFPSITRKGAGNLGYCHLSRVLVPVVGMSNLSQFFLCFDGPSGSCDSLSRNLKGMPSSFSNSSIVGRAAPI